MSGKKKFNEVPIKALAKSLSSMNRSIIGESTKNIRIFADDGEDPITHWFEIWQIRGTYPPRRLFTSPKQYIGKASALLAGKLVLKEILDLKKISCSLKDGDLIITCDDKSAVII
jgi:hypothetical protein